MIYRSYGNAEDIMIINLVEDRGPTGTDRGEFVHYTTRYGLTFMRNITHKEIFGFYGF